MADAPARVRRRIVAGIVLGTVLLVAAAAAVPQLLDWTRYRRTIEDVASRQLGRPVRIEGGIGLVLLPQPVLTADRVVIAAPDEDGPAVSLKVNALRLEVALPPLLVGRVVPRALVLHRPELRVSWPVPEPLRPGSSEWPGAFAAQIEQGRVVVGRFVLEDVDGRFASAADGTLSASGTATASGLAWHVTARLGATAEDGARTVALALDGQGRAAGLGGAFEGTIGADATVAGRLTGRGPDLSLLLPAPPVPFGAAGPVRIAAGRITAEDLALTVGGSPAEASVALQMRPAGRLDIGVSLGRLDLDRWLPALRAAPARLDGWTIPSAVDLSAEAGIWHGGTLRRLRATLVSGKAGTELRELEAVLPGEAALSAAGRLAGGTQGLRFAGSAQLAMTDLRTTLAWLAGAGGERIGALPLPRAGTVAARVTAGGGVLHLGEMAGQLDGSPLGGTLDWRPAGEPRLDADLRLDRLALDPFVPDRMPGPAVLPASLAGRLRLAVAKARLRGVGIDGFLIDAAAAEGALAVRELSGTVRGVRIAGSGTVGASGTVTDAKLDLAAADARPIEAALPPEWRLAPALWRGPIALQATAEGPPAALAVRVGLDLADARVEAQPTIDLAGRSWSGPVTLRHPGAARLLAALGLPGARDWVGDGSLSAMGQITGRPGVVTADRFDLTAGALRLGGGLSLETGTGEPRLTGRLAADALPVALPGPWDRDPPGLAGLRGWSAAVQVEADALFAAGAADRPLRQARAMVTLEGGRLRIGSFEARLGAAAVQGTAELDASGEIPAVTVEAGVSGLDVAAPLTGWPIDVVSGRGDAEIHLRGEGHSPAAVIATASGSARLMLRDGELAGLDLPAAQSALAGAGGGRAGGTEAAVRAALNGGMTPFRMLMAAATVGNGVATLQDAGIDAPSGTVAVAGEISVPSYAAGPRLDLALTLRPDLGGGAGQDASDPPAIGLRLAGPAGAPRRTPELAVMARWLAARTP
jgi:hypothetical protein